MYSSHFNWHILWSIYDVALIFYFGMCSHCNRILGMSDLYELGLNQFCFPGLESEMNSIKKVEQRTLFR